ncbi:hypothetical protein [Haloferula sp. BvORR071]|uniref:hypothetical protein n=1 Tax=Haloferula sp. BvORR071 TaxID=1396141 RepID=UPI000551006C|nr:hypothetical protein [Haloferula sp. BvORR071]
MPSPAYRSASRHTGKWLLICLLGLAGMLALMFFLSSHPVTKGLGLWIFAIAVWPFFISLAIAVFLMRKLHRDRRQGIANKLRTLGYQVTLEPTAEEKSAFFQGLEVFKNATDLRNGPGCLCWIATRSTSGGCCYLCEYEFVTGSGKSTQEHYRTLVVLPKKWPDATVGWPNAFFMWRLGKIARKLMRRQENKDPTFADLAKEWSIDGDTATGQHFLTPEVRAQLTSAPRGEIWCIGGDVLCCCYQNPMDAESIGKLLERARSIAG